MGGMGKIPYLQEQFEQAGIQEARGSDGCWETPRWIRIAAGASAGNYGVELWICKQFPYTLVDGRPMYFSKSHFSVVDNPVAICWCAWTPRLGPHGFW